MNAALPIRPQPRAGESLSGYTRRLESLNALQTGTFLPIRFADISTPSPALRQLAAASHVPIGRLRAMTLDPFPLVITGRGPKRLHGWRLPPSADWICDTCTRQYGHRALLWRTALMPICMRCRRVLVNGAEPGRPAPPELIDLVDRLSRMAMSTSRPDSRNVRDRLSRYLKLNRLIAVALTEGWPSRPSFAPPINLHEARTWGHYPPSDPVTVAGLLLTTAPALYCVDTGRRLREAALARLPTDHPARQTFRPRRRRPTRPVAPIIGVDRRSDWQRLGDLRERVGSIAADHGIGIDHIPALLPRSGDEGGFPPVWAIPHRHDLATALQVLVEQTARRTVAVTRLRHRMGAIAPTPTDFIDDIIGDRGISAPNADLIIDGLDTLIAASLADYHQRRETLRSIRHLPAPLIAGIRSDDAAPATTLALGWIWHRVTHGHLDTSRIRQVTDTQIRELDSRLDPENKLALLEHAERLLGATQRLVDEHQRPTPTAVNDRRRA